MTIREIAEKAGVSIGTVDRVIHHRGRVAPETVEKIEALVAESGYTPNPLARQLKLNKDYSIGVLLPALDSESGYWSLVYDGINGAAAELAPFPVSIELEEFDRSKHGDCLRAGRALLKKGCEALVIAPVMRADMLELTALLGPKPYVFVDSPLPEAAPLATVAQNPYNGGFCAGRMMDLLCPAAMAGRGIRKRHFLSLQMHAGTYNLAERSRGFCSYFEKKAEVTDLVWQGGGQAAFFRFMEEAFHASPAVDGIFVTNDAVFRVAAWLKDRQRTGGTDIGVEGKRIRLIGYDLLPENRQALLSGDIDCIISQCADMQGRAAVNAIYRSELLRQNTREKVLIPIEVYFKENLT